MVSSIVLFLFFYFLCMYVEDLKIKSLELTYKQEMEIV